MANLGIHLIGRGGSGKTYIARILSNKLQIPRLDLDEIFWSKTADSYGEMTPPVERDARLTAFLQQDEWIVEGVFHRWLFPSFQAATHIIVLTTPLWLSQTRTVRRFLRRKFGFESGKKETFRGLREFLAWNRDYDRDNLTRALAMLDEHGLHYIKCHNALEMEEVFQRE